jgi:hypothetical protein
MSSIVTNDREPTRASAAHRASAGLCPWGAIAIALATAIVAACGSDAGAGPGDAAGPADTPAPCIPPAPGSAPTYTELYANYFAVGKPGHCAMSGCHSSSADSTGWVCGPNKDTCYGGMVGIGLINTTYPTASQIADPRQSPLSWINPAGPMPNDATRGPFPAGRDAILAWVAACAQNN